MITEKEYEEIARRLRPRLRAVGRQLLGTDAEGEDVAQEALLRLWLLRHRMADAGHAEALLLTMARNDEEGKDYCTGFAFEGEFVADFPYCLDGDVSEVSIEADMPCEVRIISGRELQALFDSDPAMAKMDVKILKNLFKMVYSRSLDHYRYTARGRYLRLLDRCPQVAQMLSLKDIASFLNISPIYLSKIRKEITLGDKTADK